MTTPIGRSKSRGTMQCSFSVNEVRLRNLKDSFKEMGIGPGSGRNGEVFNVEELEALLVNIFQLANTNQEHVIAQEKCVELTLSFLLKCLDRYAHALSIMLNHPL